VSGGWRTAAAALGLAALGSGCSDLPRGRDSLTLGAGDAMRHNRVAHMAPTHPKQTGNVDFPTSGARLAPVMEAYRSSGEGEGTGEAGGGDAAAADQPAMPGAE